MVRRRSKPQRYPLHRTYVTKRIRTYVTKVIQSNDNERSEKEENGNGYDSPYFAIGCLVEFHFREDQAKMYTIQWESFRRKDKNNFDDNTRLESDSEASSKSHSEARMPRIFDCSACTEVWTESRVAIGILLNRNMGLKVAKHFERGVFIGQVTNVYSSGIGNDGVAFYCIEYRHGGSECYEEKELQEGVALYSRIEEQQKSALFDQSMGLKVAKYFGTSVFFGQVTNVFEIGIENDGEVNYHIEYGDGDSEDFDEHELQEGVELYSHVQKQQKRKRKYNKKKECKLIEDIEHTQRKRDASHSFGALYDNATPIHTLILGTHPAKKSLNQNRYFAHPSNAFWWIAGDCLGFRRDRGERSTGGLMKLCADLRYDQSYIVPYDKQVDILCHHGFALWDIVASCQRKGSLDRAIKNDKPNDIKGFVDKNPTIKAIVLANGKSGLTFFNRHFAQWLKSKKFILQKSEATSSSYEPSISNFNEDEIIKAKETGTIACICALSVSPAATLTYKEKRDFWDRFVYSPGLKFQQQIATTTKLGPPSASPSKSGGIVLPSNN